MAKKSNKTEDQFIQVEEALSKTEQYIENNQKIIVQIVAVIIAIIALFLGFKKLYIEPMEIDAKAEMYMAELYFEKDSFNLALNGDGQYFGFLDIADEYSLTKQGELAKYYAGISYLHLSQYENAIDYLEDFSSDDILLSSFALGCIGDAYMEMNDLDNALKYYNKASNNSDNKLTTPRYLFKQALIHEINKNYTEALEIYNVIKDKYKTSSEGNGIEKYISRAENR